MPSIAKNKYKRIGLRTSWDNSLAEELDNQVKIAKRIENLRKIIHMRKMNSMTLQAIGNEFNLSRERIRQILEQFGLDGRLK